nr:hypothetical protein [Nocardia sp. NRRL S-836]
MKDDAGQDDLGSVIGGSLGEPGCQAAELLEAVEAALDHVAHLVKIRAESR